MVRLTLGAQAECDRQQVPEDQARARPGSLIINSKYSHTLGVQVTCMSWQGRRQGHP